MKWRKMPKGFFDVSPVVSMDGLGYNGMRPGPGVREYLFRDYIREEDMPGYSKGEDGNILKQFGAAVKAGRMDWASLKRR